MSSLLNPAGVNGRFGLSITQVLLASHSRSVGSSHVKSGVLSQVNGSSVNVLRSSSYSSFVAIDLHFWHLAHWAAYKSMAPRFGYREEIYFKKKVMTISLEQINSPFLSNKRVRQSRYFKTNNRQLKRSRRLLVIRMSFSILFIQYLSNILVDYTWSLFIDQWSYNQRGRFLPIIKLQ